MNSSCLINETQKGHPKPNPLQKYKKCFCLPVRRTIKEDLLLLASN